MLNEAKYIKIEDIYEILENGLLKKKIPPETSEWIINEITKATDPNRFKSPNWKNK